MLSENISFEEVNWKVEMYDWELWEHKVMVSKWVYDILLNWGEEQVDMQVAKIWKWINRKVSYILNWEKWTI